MLHLISVNSNVSHAPHCRIYQNTLLAKMSDSRFQKDYCPALKFKKLKGLKCQKTIDRSIPFSWKRIKYYQKFVAQSIAMES